MAGCLPKLALPGPLTSAQTRLLNASWSHIDRLALACYWELALQLVFFDEEIDAFCKLWRLIARKQTPLSSCTLLGVNRPWQATGTPHRSPLSALVLQPAFRRCRLGRSGWRRPGSSPFN